MNVNYAVRDGIARNAIRAVEIRRARLGARARNFERGDTVVAA